MPWHHQKKLLKQDIPSYQETIEYIKEMDHPKVQALFTILYLTGARIREIVRSLEKKDIQLLEKDGKKIMLVTLYNEKNRRRKVKKIPINIEKEYDLVEIFLKYIDELDDEGFIFDMTHNNAWRLIKKYTGVNPHYIRHLRLTHLVTEFNFNEQELKIFAGWSDTRMSSFYIEMRWSDLLKKL